MLDFENLEKYRENNRIEAKKALGGLPHSIWETYSAFANTPDVFCFESVHSYRMRMKYARPGHVWEDLNDSDFLFRLGAVGRGADGRLHPTAAGLLMFGYEYEIIREYPMYFLDYQEKMEDNVRWTDRIVSSSGDWSGNVYDFYFRVYNRLSQDIRIPFRIENGRRIDDTPVHTALREALANCLVNADYYGHQGLVIIKKHDRIMFSNPGAFRIDIDVAKSGGISDPRNSSLLKMFNLIDIGERAGSGIPNIYYVWKNQGWKEPTIIEGFEPERITLDLSIGKIGDKKSAIKIGDKKSAIKESIKMQIVEYLTDHTAGKASEIAEYIGLKPSRTRDYLKELISENIVIAEGANRNRIYRLRA